MHDNFFDIGINLTHESFEFDYKNVLEKAFAWQKKILIIDDINDTGATLRYIEDNFGKGDGRIKFAVLVNNTPSKVTVDYHGYEINKDEVPSWIVFPWEEWDK